MSSYASRALDSLISTTLPSPVTYNYSPEQRKFVSSELSTLEKTVYYATNFFKAVLIVAALPVLIPLSCLGYLKDKFIEWLYPKAPERVLSQEEITQALAQNVGAVGPADSTFQSCGHGTSVSRPQFQGRCDWAEWVNNPSGHIDSTAAELRNSYRNYLDDPAPLIRILKEMGATAYRFSIERSVIEPERGQIDRAALEKYLKFCRALRNAGIEPWITLDHYVRPNWFAASGGFSSEENIDDFVNYACNIIRILNRDESHITHIMTFNELGVDGFQRDVRQRYPHGPEGGLGVSFRNMQNMMRAHCSIFERTKAESDLDVKVGLTHQFLKFKASNPYNIIERITCFVLNLITHYFAFNFFKAGSLQAPFCMNTRIVTNRRPLDFLGVQSYGPAVLKVGFGSGEEPNSVYACNKFRVPLLGYFVTGATSEEGGTIQSFGPTLNPEYLEINLREAEELNTDRSPNDRIDIAITETGCDANCCRWGQNVPSFDESAQLNYYQRIFPIVAKFKLAAFFFWTLFRGQHEWESGVGNKNGKGILIGVIDATIDPNTGVITSHQLSPAAVHIKQTFDAISAFNARANARPVAA